MLAAFGKQFGFAAIARGRLTNDALIAASAARLEIAVVTAKARDFERLASLRPFRWQLAPPDWGDSGRGSTRAE
ncbi:MAG: type II toxin-antitoxin system VapC family toxin [Terriglobales bacterium]